MGHHRDALPHGVERQGPEVLTVQQDGGQPPGVERSAATNGLCDVRLQMGLCDLVPFRVITPWAHRQRPEKSRSEHPPRWFHDPTLRGNRQLPVGVLWEGRHSGEPQPLWSPAGGPRGPGGAALDVVEPIQ